MTPEQKAALEKKMKDAAATMAKNKALNDAFNAGKTALDAKDFPPPLKTWKRQKAWTRVRT